MLSMLFSGLILLLLLCCWISSSPTLPLFVYLLLFIGLISFISLFIGVAGTGWSLLYWILVLILRLGGGFRV